MQPEVPVQAEEPPPPTFVPFSEFPTPELLAKAQVEYATSGADHEVDDDGTSKPFPPPTNKQSVLDAERWQLIDKHVKRVNIDIIKGHMKRIVLTYSNTFNTITVHYACNSFTSEYFIIIVDKKINDSEKFHECFSRFLEFPIVVIYKVITTMVIRPARPPHMMCSISGRPFTTLLFGVRGDWDNAIIR